MKVVVVLGLLVVFANGQGTCDGNLVQALQKCATSISNGESLAMQQEKCSPNGCNYDCPSANVLGSLGEAVQNVTAWLGNLQQSVATVIADVQTNAAGITSNINDIASNADSITENANNVASNTDDISGIADRYYACGSFGWKRVAYMDMSDPSTDCPTEFRQYEATGLRVCGRQVSGSPSCDSIVFAVDQSYSEICGRVRGFQFGSADAIGYSDDGHDDLNSNYLDGVSITRGNPRTHVWTFMGGLSEAETHGNTCPCNFGTNVEVQSFIGDDYYCESGNAGTGWGLIFYGTDRLWDGEDCGSNEYPCCQNPAFPYFYKALDDSTMDAIELRICGDEASSNEDTPITLYEIFVK